MAWDWLDAARYADTNGYQGDNERTTWEKVAGGGTKPGISYGETDDLAMNVVKDGVHIHDLQATLLHLLGINHEKLTYRFQGRQFRLTDVHGEVVNEILL